MQALFINPCLLLGPLHLVGNPVSNRQGMNCAYSFPLKMPQSWGNARGLNKFKQDTSTLLQFCMNILKGTDLVISKT